VLVHAEEVRIKHASERVYIGREQQWRGAGASADVLAECSERASVLANWSFNSGSGAFWDGDDDNIA
jgi:hypothetical protein